MFLLIWPPGGGRPWPDAPGSSTCIPFPGANAWGSGTASSRNGAWSRI